MTDIELVDKINDTFKEDTEFGMTLAGLIEIAPRDFFLPVQGGEILFTKAEVNKVIKYLNAFDLTLKEMVRANKYKRVYGTEETWGKSVLTEKTNLELEKKPTVEYGREPTDAEVDQAFEEAEAFQNEVDEEATTPAAIQ
jgi:hypothetical protein